jgi:phosphopantothenoylcysteine decarboxylase/phosphopantothenate--cysteine ligase
MGYALARAAWRRGAQVVLVSGPSPLADPEGVEVVRVESAREMRDRVAALLPDMDVAVFAAAVADYRPSDPRSGKVKRAETGPGWDVAMVENPDVARETETLRKPGAIAVGFALETSEMVENALRKLEAKGFDLVVANDASREGSGFEVETNEVILLHRGGAQERLPLMSKDEVAEEVLDRVGALLAPPGGPAGSREAGEGQGG